VYSFSVEYPIACERVVGFMTDEDFFKDENCIACIRIACVSDEEIKALFPEPELHNGIFYCETFIN
jgi:hypothetical protein